MTIIQMLEGVTPIGTPKHTFKNIQEARIWAKVNITGLYRNQNTGKNIYVSKNAVDKYLNNKTIEKSLSMDVHLSALKKMPDLIKNAILKEAMPDERESPHIREIQRFYGAIDYEKDIYPVKITVKAYLNKLNKAYSYEVMKIESPILQSELSGQSKSDGCFSDSGQPSSDFPMADDPHSSPNLYPSAVKKSVICSFRLQSYKIIFK